MRRRAHDEQHVEPELVGFAQTGVEHAGELLGVARRIEHDQRLGQLGNGCTRREQTDAVRPPRAARMRRAATRVASTISTFARGRVVRRERARRARSRRPCAARRSRPIAALDFGPADATDAQDARAPLRSRRRWSTRHRRGTGRRRARRARRRRDRRARASAVVGLTRPKRLADGAATPPPNAVEQLQRDRMIGHAHAHRVAPAGDFGHDALGVATHDDRERAGPERVGEHRAPTSGTSRASSSSWAARATCTITGWSAGRPFTAKRRRTAVAFAASAPRP